MTDNDIMEEISKGYLELIAHRSGFFNCNGRDYGTDMSIRRAIPRAIPHSDRRRYLTLGKSVDIQIKAVSESYVRDLNDPTKIVFKYDLEVKNYNDLIARSSEKGAYIPLILVVFIMPQDKASWVMITQNELTVKKCAYWYQILPSALPSNNKESVTIDIPKLNIVSMDFYEFLFSRLD